MSVGDAANLVLAILAVIGALIGAGVWLMGIGEKLGNIVTATEATTASLQDMGKKIDVVEGHLDNHSMQLNSHSMHLNALRDDVVDLQNRIPRKA